MSTFAERLNQFVTRLSCFLFLFSLSALSATRLYVQPLTTENNAEKLRSALEQELRRRNDIVLADNPSSAEVTLDGAGEIWVKGYQSLNPRSGRLAQNGTPVYDGYLAIELKSKEGQTFWSYLVTPSPMASDVLRDLAKQIAHRVSDALREGQPPAFTSTVSKPSAILRAAGATFPQPVYSKWFNNYRLANPNLEIGYDAIGSEAGVRRLLAGETDIGASDSPVILQDLAPARQRDYLLLPTVVGAVVPIINLPGITQPLELTPQALAGIYLGTITKWNHPLIQASNRGVKVPDLEITVVHRSDGSGTSYAWTEFLSAANSGWKSKVGSGLQPNWPVGKGADGNEGVAQTVKEIGGSIGYVEFIYALKHHMTFAKVQNREGEFISASLESMARAASTAVMNNDNLQISIVNPPGHGAYPIASFTWLVIPATIPDLSRLTSLKGFLHWMLGPGQLQAAALGYLALPKQVIAREQAIISRWH